MLESIAINTADATRIIELTGTSIIIVVAYGTLSLLLHFLRF